MANIKKISDECYIRIKSKAELVSLIDGTAIQLTVTEYKILEYFIDNVNKSVSLQDLAVALWGINYEADDKDPASIKSQISRLRKKLNRIKTGLNKCIDTNYGLGTYTLVQHSAAGSCETATTEQNDTSNVHPAQFRDLKSKGYSPVSIAQALVKNDLALYASVFQKKKITPENEGTVMQWAEYLSSAPETFQYLINDADEIVGNFSFVSITHEQMELYIAGQLYEKDFSPENTRDLFCSGKDHILFLLNMSVNDEYNTVKNNILLRKMFLEQLVSFAENNIFFSTILTNVYKASQEAFYKQWGFSYIGDNRLSGRIYRLDLLPYPDSLYTQLNNNSFYKNLNEYLGKMYGR